MEKMALFTERKNEGQDMTLSEALEKQHKLINDPSSKTVDGDKLIREIYGSFESKICQDCKEWLKNEQNTKRIK